MQMCGSDFPEKSALMIHPLVQGPFKSPGLILLLVGLLVGLLIPVVGYIIAIIGLVFIILWLLDQA